MYRSHASVYSCVIANSFSMVIAYSPHLNLKWKGEAECLSLSQRAQHHGSSPAHVHVNRWKAKHVSDSCTEAPIYIFSSFFVAEWPFLHPSAVFLYVCFIYVLLYESELPAVFCNNLYSLANLWFLLDVITLYSTWYMIYTVGRHKCRFLVQHQETMSECSHPCFTVYFWVCNTDVSCRDPFKPRRSAALWNILRVIVD